MNLSNVSEHRHLWRGRGLVNIITKNGIEMNALLQVSEATAKKKIKTQLQRLNWWQYPSIPFQPGEISKHLLFLKGMDIVIMQQWDMEPAGAGHTWGLRYKVSYSWTRVTTEALWPRSYYNCSVKGTLSEKPFSAANGHHPFSWSCNSLLYRVGIAARHVWVLSSNRLVK